MAVELLALVVVEAGVVVVVLVFATSASITLLFSLLESHCGNILPTFFELIGVAYQHVSFPHNFRFRMSCQHTLNTKCSPIICRWLDAAGRGGGSGFILFYSASFVK